RTRKQQDTKTSTNGKSVDPDEPRKLVADLLKTEPGVIWLKARWEELRDQLAPEAVFQAPDRFRAGRLIGCQPASARPNRTVALIYVASYVLRREGNTPFDDLLSDMNAGQIERFYKKVKVRWPDLFELKEKEEAREILIDLVEENIEQLNELISEFESKREDFARRTLNLINCDDTPAGHTSGKDIHTARDGLYRTAS